MHGGNAAKCVIFRPEWESTPPGTKPALMIDPRLLRVVEWYAIEISAAISFVRRAPILSGSISTSYPPPSVVCAEVARTAMGCDQPSEFRSLSFVHPLPMISGRKILTAGSSSKSWMFGLIRTASIWNLVRLVILKHSKFWVMNFWSRAFRTMGGTTLSFQWLSFQIWLSVTMSSQSTQAPSSHCTGPYLPRPHCRPILCRSLVPRAMLRSLCSWGYPCTLVCLQQRRNLYLCGPGAKTGCWKREHNQVPQANAQFQLEFIAFFLTFVAVPRSCSSIGMISACFCLRLGLSFLSSTLQRHALTRKTARLIPMRKHAQKIINRRWMDGWMVVRSGCYSSQLNLWQFAPCETSALTSNLGSFIPPKKHLPNIKTKTKEANKRL